MGAANGITVCHHVSGLQLQGTREHADRSLPVHLRLQAVRSPHEARPGQVLRLLFLRLGQVPFDAKRSLSLAVGLAVQLLRLARSGQDLTRASLSICWRTLALPAVTHFALVWALAQVLGPAAGQGNSSRAACSNRRAKRDVQSPSTEFRDPLGLLEDDPCVVGIDGASHFAPNFDGGI
jgi:hypothetical protein